MRRKTPNEDGRQVITSLLTGKNEGRQERKRRGRKREEVGRWEIGRGKEKVYMRKGERK